VIPYLGKSLAAWFMGFFPFFEIYVAVPAAIAMGLDYVSAVAWASLGNFTPVLLIVLASNHLRKLPRVAAWLDARTVPRLQRWVDRYGAAFILLVTPIIGVWALAVTGVGLGVKPHRLLAFSGISILLYAVLVALGVALGMEAFRPTPPPA
jgi:uncharacterized membrane protein